jgi:hypothetical protein
MSTLTLRLTKEQDKSIEEIKVMFNYKTSSKAINHMLNDYLEKHEYCKDIALLHGRYQRDLNRLIKMNEDIEEGKKGLKEFLKELNNQERYNMRKEDITDDY